MKIAFPILFLVIVMQAFQPALAKKPATQDPQAGKPASQSEPAPQAQEDHIKVAEAIHRGITYLIRDQNPDGSWGTGLETRGFEVYNMVPGTQDGMRAATTALCVMALREVGDKTAHDKGVRYLVAHGEARRDSGDLLYNTWANIYVLQALAIEMRHTSDPNLKRGIKKAAEWQLDRLGRYETYMGGWNYYDFGAHTEKPSTGPTSFGTAAGLVALWEARQSGLDVPQKMVDRAIKRLAEMRLGHAFLYGSDYKYIPRLPANQPRGSVGRTQSANFALWQWNADGVDKAMAVDSLEFFFKEHDYIEMGRQRQYPHESWYQTAPYYYYFGHYYAARLVERLDEPQKTDFGGKLAQQGILPFQESDGSWWDYAMWDYHKPYGTAFAIMTLLRCEPPEKPGLHKSS
jgi:hypothetical protein